MLSAVLREAFTKGVAPLIKARSPEKAGGGSIPSLATINFNPSVKNFNPSKTYCARDE